MIRLTLGRRITHARRFEARFRASFRSGVSENYPWRERKGPELPVVPFAQYYLNCGLGQQTSRGQSLEWEVG